MEPSGTQFPPRSRLPANELCVGCIVWLPAKKTHHSDIHCVSESCPTQEALDEGGYDHPDLVVRIWDDSPDTSGSLICDILCLTTHNKTNLQKFKRKQARTTNLQTSIPIYYRGSGSAELHSQPPGTQRS
ncbi:hypothetical protein BJ875DRAFT_475893 [Amylocarpus encephaloides]|uniref:Uncharacterized protein n=1 Tax=Amylocarpus encephaloides TaxID=45428 RepID=A0A9P8C0N5_9HELO|nr:hypothetical protein BJ875DRAFT_475893 [Amylocarpus encephaloides]